MMNVIATIIAAATTFAGVTGNTVHTSRQLILGGHPVTDSSHQYVAGLRDSPYENTFCGGVLITKLHVLTTQTCVEHIQDGMSMYAAIGARYIMGLNFPNGTQDGERIKVETITIHPKYNNDTTSYDFALLTLEKESQFPPIQLPTTDVKPGTYLDAFGWGSTTTSDSLFPKNLQVVELEAWSNDHCDDIFDIDESMICAGGENGKGACVGDVGGPLVQKTQSGDVLMGLSSMSDCNPNGTPDIFSRVSSAMDWLSECI
ncbi:hypothetical protein CCR75_008020 [Bremia lactucae]|uniref:Peptidase S1 domain-containing protein n=1 Tax=Bremia lactucae TaxID=4779 RepID=A0A976FFQ0_BRELC|nr:hypothetical protein CCR75_008020 [Bremia lactucae]